MITPSELKAGIAKMQETATISRVYVDKESRDAYELHVLCERMRWGGELPPLIGYVPTYRGVRVLARGER